MNTVVITEEGGTVVLEQDSLQTVEVIAQGPPGPTGPTGPDPWDEPVQRITHTSGNLTLNYTLGKHVILTVEGNVTSLAITGFPTAYHIARLTLEIINTGPYDIQAFSNIIWSNGQAPSLTSGGRDLLVFITADGGLHVYGNTVGQDYR